jgi:hypothetical protein
MSVDRAVQKRRQDRQDMLDLDATEEPKRVRIRKRKVSTDLVTRLRMQANVFSNLAFWSGREPTRKRSSTV